MMNKLFTPIYLLGLVCMISSCKDKDIAIPPPTPKEGEIAFAIDGKAYAGEAEITPVNGIGARNRVSPQ